MMWVDGSGQVHYEQTPAPVLPAVEDDNLVVYAKARRDSLLADGSLDVPDIGVPIRTDATTRARLADYMARVQRSPGGYVVQAWTTDGGDVSLDSGQILAASDAVMDRWNDVYLAYSLVKKGIADGSITTTDQVDQILV